MHIKPNKAKAGMLAKRQLAEFLYDAVNLEGIRFTFPEIQTLPDGITVGGQNLFEADRIKPGMNGAQYSGRQKPMNPFMRSCLDEKVIDIMKE